MSSPRIPRTADAQTPGGRRRSGLEGVELGAAQGYWARLLARAGVAPVTPLDVAPPEGRQRRPAVRWGTAESLADAPEGTLLLCMPSPGEEELSDLALAQFAGRRVAYVGEWGSGMTATKRFHATLASPRHFTLRRVVPLPNFAKTAVALHLFERTVAPPGGGGDGGGGGGGLGGGAGGGGKPKRKRGDGDGAGAGMDERGGGAAAAAVRPLAAAACCTGCGSAGPLWRCPWSRQLLVCGEACYAAAETAHRAQLALCFCGAAVGARPPWAEWEPLRWLEHATATDAQWDAMRDATPQAELRPRGAPRPRAHGSVIAHKRAQ